MGRLVADGSVRLQDPVSRFFPNVHPGWAEHTLADLLLHRTQLPASTWLSQYGEEPGAIRTGVLSAEPVDRPSVPAQYLNRGYIVLGWLVESVVGEPFDQVVAREWWGSLGLGGTHFKPLDAGVPSGRIAPNGAHRRRGRPTARRRSRRECPVARWGRRPRRGLQYLGRPEPVRRSRRGRRSLVAARARLPAALADAGRGMGRRPLPRARLVGLPRRSPGPPRRIHRHHDLPRAAHRRRWCTAHQRRLLRSTQPSGAGGAWPALGDHQWRGPPVTHAAAPRPSPVAAGGGRRLTSEQHADDVLRSFGR